MSSRPTTYDSMKCITFRLTNQGIRQVCWKLHENARKYTWNKQNTVMAYATTATNTTIITAPTQQRQYVRKHLKCNKSISHLLGELFTSIKCNKNGNIANFCKCRTPTTTSQGTSTRMGTTIGRNWDWSKELNATPRENITKQDFIVPSQSEIDARKKNNN